MDTVVSPSYGPSAAMSMLRSLLRNPAMRLYFLGHLLILLGAWLMEATHSMLPMALAARRVHDDDQRCHRRAHEQQSASRIRSEHSPSGIAELDRGPNPHDP